MKLEFSRHIFEKYSNIKFHENRSSVSRIVPCTQTYRHTGGHAGMTKLIAAFRNFANATKTLPLVQARFVRFIVISDSSFTCVRTILFFFCIVILSRACVVWLCCVFGVPAIVHLSFIVDSEYIHIYIA
jgi:hypothetical protein